jgi:hypothetical protein
MNLNAYVAEKRLKIFEELNKGLAPSEGEFDAARLAEGRVKGDPQMGATRYEPNAIFLEFIYPDRSTSATILTVRFDAPERIVFLPVPNWVIENIWQGDVSGMYCFESVAREMTARFLAELEPNANEKWFKPQAAKRRE